MKKGFFSAMVILGMAAAAPAMALADEGAREIQIGITDAYVPGGFNSGSDAFVVANGIFPNGCYRWSRAEVKDVSTSTHEVKSFATVTPGMCIMALIPFNKEVRLGKLNAGTHQIRFLNGDGTYLEKQMVVE